MDRMRRDAAVVPDPSQMDHEARTHIALLQRTDEDIHDLNKQLKQMGQRLEELKRMEKDRQRSSARGGLARLLVLIGVFFLGVYWGPVLLQQESLSGLAQLISAPIPTGGESPAVPITDSDFSDEAPLSQQATIQAVPPPIQATSSALTAIVPAAAIPEQAQEAFVPVQIDQTTVKQEPAFIQKQAPEIPTEPTGEPTIGYPDDTALPFMPEEIPPIEIAPEAPVQQERLYEREVQVDGQIKI